MPIGYVPYIRRLSAKLRFTPTFSSVCSTFSVCSNSICSNNSVSSNRNVSGNSTVGSTSGTVFNTSSTSSISSTFNISSTSSISSVCSSYLGWLLSTMNKGYSVSSSRVSGYGDILPFLRGGLYG